MKKILIAILAVLMSVGCMEISSETPNVEKIMRNVRSFESTMSSVAWHGKFYPVNFDSLRTIKHPEDTSMLIGYSIIHTFASVKNPTFGQLRECIYYITPDYRVVEGRNAREQYRHDADSIGIEELLKKYNHGNRSQ